MVPVLDHVDAAAGRAGVSGAGGWAPASSSYFHGLGTTAAGVSDIHAGGMGMINPGGGVMGGGAGGSGNVTSAFNNRTYQSLSQQSRLN